MKDTMRAARLHQPGKPMQIDTVAVPKIRPHEVLVRVEAAGVISNMNAVFSGQYWYHLPPLPAIVRTPFVKLAEPTPPSAAFSPATNWATVAPAPPNETAAPPSTL